MKKQIGICLSTIILLLCGCAGNNEENTLTAATLSCEQDWVDAGEPLEIRYAIEPADAPLTKDSFSLSGGTITLQEGSAWFSSEEPGTYEITLSEGDVRSNTLTISVRTPEEQSEGTATEDTLPATDEEATPHNAPMRVDDLLKQASAYAGSGVQVWVQGDLPQSPITDENGELQTILWNDDHSRYLILKGEIETGGCRAAIIGTMESDAQGRYVIYVDNIKAMD